MQETQIGSLGWEDPLEEEMATHSSVLAWKIPWTEESALAGYSPWGCKELGHGLATKPPPVPGSRKEIKGSYILLSGCKRRKAPQTIYTQFTELTIPISKFLNRQTFVAMISAHYG